MANSSRWRGKELPDRIGTVKLQQSVTLLARQEDLVWGKLPSHVPMSPGSTVVVEPTSSRAMPRNIMVGHVITPLWGDRWIPVKVNNLLNKQMQMCLLVWLWKILRFSRAQASLTEISQRRSLTLLCPQSSKKDFNRLGSLILTLISVMVAQRVREKLVRLLESYNDIFSKHTLDWGEAKGFVHRI